MKQEKILAVAFIIVVSYFFLSFLIHHFFFIAEDNSAFHLYMFSILLPLVVALGVGLGASYKLGKEPKVNLRQKALRIVKRKLSEDEKRLLKEVETAGSITQDSLRSRLNWSKAKVSTLLTRLDKMNLIQKEKQGKTYRIFLAKDLRPF